MTLGLSEHNVKLGRGLKRGVRIDIRPQFGQRISENRLDCLCPSVGTLIPIPTDCGLYRLKFPESVSESGL